MIRGLILVLALAAGGVAAWLTLGLQGQTSETIAANAAPVPKIELQEILVAAADLTEGHKLTGDDLRWQSWPEAAMNPGFITRSGRPDAGEALAGSVVRDSMVAGEPVREGKLAQPGTGFLSAMLPAGKRAVAVPVSAETTAGGFIRPHDRVDVIATPRDSDINSSRTIATNIKVLAIDQNANQAEAENATVGKTATLELDPDQAEAVASALAMGAISLALRSSDDIEEAPTTNLETAATTVRILRAGRSETVKSQ